MVKSKATTVEKYLLELPTDRRKAISDVRKIILKNIPKGYVEVMRWGMIAYEIPLKTYPTTTNKQPLTYAALSSQKNYMAVYLLSLYNDDVAFRQEYAKSGKKLDMGKCCVRFKKIEDLPLPLIGKAIARYPVKEFITAFEKARRIKS